MTAVIHSVVSGAVAIWSLTWIGNSLCKLILDRSGLSAAREARAPQDETLTPNAGKVIGVLERLVVAGGLIFGAWEVMAAVVALKSVARFKELDEKLDAEYFLVGSLVSLGWAALVTELWLQYDHSFGLDIAARLAP